MAYTDKQKTRRLELENQQTRMSDAERFLLAALNDLRDADISGDNIEGCEKTVKMFEEAVAKKGEAIIEVEDRATINGKEIIPGGHAVQTLINTLSVE